MTKKQYIDGFKYFCQYILKEMPNEEDLKALSFTFDKVLTDSNNDEEEEENE